VLVYAEGRHVYPLLPVISELGAGGSPPVVLDQDLSPDARAQLLAAGLEVVDPAQAPGATTASDLAPLAAEAWRAAAGAPALAALGEEEIGTSIWPLVAFQFDWLFETGFVEIGRRLSVAQAAVAWLEPTALLTPVDTSVNDLAWVATCKARRIPVIAQLHGATYIEPGRSLWGRGEADLTAVWGELTREWHVAATDRPHAAFSAVGYPRFDELAQQRPDRARARAARGFGEEIVVVLLTSMAGGAVGSYYRSPLDIYRGFLDAVEGVPDAAAVVRPHPASDLTAALVGAAGRGGRTSVDTGGDLVELLAAADVVVGQPTTSLLEAMVLDRPAIVWAAGAAPELLWWERHAPLPTARTAEQLADLVLRLARPGSPRDAALRDQGLLLDLLVGPRDGGAARRAADLVARVAACHEVT
jgi:hypothetical protein